LLLDSDNEQDNARRLDISSLLGDGLSAVVEPVDVIFIDICFIIVGRSISSKPQRKSDERIISHTVLCEPCVEISTS
jgi:hypothetical protein